MSTHIRYSFESTSFNDITKDLDPLKIVWELDAYKIIFALFSALFRRNQISDILANFEHTIGIYARVKNLSLL